MHTEPDIPINIFIVDPENQKLVSGAVSFTQRSRQKLRGLIFAFGLIPLIGVGILFVFNRISSSAGCAPYLLIVALE